MSRRIPTRATSRAGFREASQVSDSDFDEAEDDLENFENDYAVFKPSAARPSRSVAATTTAAAAAKPSTNPSRRAGFGTGSGIASSSNSRDSKPSSARRAVADDDAELGFGGNSEAEGRSRNRRAGLRSGNGADSEAEKGPVPVPTNGHRGASRPAAEVDDVLSEGPKVKRRRMTARKRVSAAVRPLSDYVSAGGVDRLVAFQEWDVSDIQGSLNRKTLDVVLLRVKRYFADKRSKDLVGLQGEWPTPEPGTLFDVDVTDGVFIARAVAHPSLNAAMLKGDVVEGSVVRLTGVTRRYDATQLGPQPLLMVTEMTQIEALPAAMFRDLTDAALSFEIKSPLATKLRDIPLAAHREYYLAPHTDDVILPRTILERPVDPATETPPNVSLLRWGKRVTIASGMSSFASKHSKYKKQFAAEEGQFMLVRLVRRGNMHHYGRPESDPHDPFPINVTLMIADETHTDLVPLVCWGASYILRQSDWDALVSGALLLISGFRIKQNYGDGSVEISINARNPPGRIFVIRDVPADVETRVPRSIVDSLIHVYSPLQLMHVPDSQVVCLSAAIIYASPTNQIHNKRYTRWFLCGSPSECDYLFALEAIATSVAQAKLLEFFEPGDVIDAQHVKVSSLHGQFPHPRPRIVFARSTWFSSFGRRVSEEAFTTAWDKDIFVKDRVFPPLSIDPSVKDYAYVHGISGLSSVVVTPIKEISLIKDSLVMNEFKTCLTQGRVVSTSRSQIMMMDVNETDARSASNIFGFLMPEDGQSIQTRSRKQNAFVFLQTDDDEELEEVPVLLQPGQIICVACAISASGIRATHVFPPFTASS
ncbi:putative mitochondrial protein [Andalucia godoyi]|uniref:Putative mitochondrial protein n=1 Tax=Andalucia godoyi TaxID=505711 RepID=A0A8K0F419_ANDGO|nr:putative mitochondrial protein [Andalucia godoyi]|eukprot:ANDGO_00823.mRNA.1 putative mitochondrial protein